MPMEEGQCRGPNWSRLVTTNAAARACDVVSAGLASSRRTLADEVTARLGRVAVWHDLRCE